MAPGVTVGCDVVGTTNLFDFKQGIVNIGATSATIEIYMDYGPSGATNLAPFAVTSVPRLLSPTCSFTARAARSMR